MDDDFKLAMMLQEQEQAFLDLSDLGRGAGLSEEDFPTLGVAPAGHGAHVGALEGATEDEVLAMRLHEEERMDLRRRLLALGAAGAPSPAAAVRSDLVPRDSGEDEDADSGASGSGDEPRGEDSGTASDLDGLSYEQLTALGELAGVVSRGADERTLGALKGVRYRRPDCDQPEQCLICREELEAGELVADLACGHAIRIECARAWFSHRAACPMCGAELRVDPGEGGL